MKEIKITTAKMKGLHDGLEGCPEAQNAIRNAFPEVFEDKWVDIGKDVKVELGRCCGKGRYAINLRYEGDILGTLWADGTLDLCDGYKAEKDDTHGEYCFKFYKKS